MKSILRAAVFAIAVAGSAALSGPVVAQTDPDLRNPKIAIGYIEPTTESFKPLLQRLKTRQFLEEFSQFLSPLRLPRRLRLVAQECDDKNASNFYLSSAGAIVFCYEFLQFIENASPTRERPSNFATRQEAIVGMFVGSALHETGHAIFDMMNAPVFGREEDAADELAIFVALQFNRDVARTIVKGRSFFYGMLGNPSTREGFSDEHGTSSQRFFNFLCLAYGGSPDVFRDLANGFLPAARARNCAGEYQKVSRAFTKTVLPYIDQDMMKKVQGRQWLRSTDLR